MARAIRRAGDIPAEASSFIGRRRELAEIKTKLSRARLVSLTGPGGVGKTRLAVRIAADLSRGLRDGGSLVELAEVLDPDAVSSAALAALDLRDQAAAAPRALLLSYLRDRELLLVVDNCEHLLGAAGRLVTEVLRAAPGVRVIATSREPLSVPGEHVVPVPPLGLPGPGAAAPLDRLRQSETVMLFTERAVAASGDFELTAANVTAVAELCRRLDGLPLAIELAAVRTRVLTAEQILDRLADRFGLLTGGSLAAGPRHQALRTTIDWSYDLLDGEERAALRRCGVFAGRFTLEDFEAVCTSPGGPTAGAAGALDLLSSLVDKSLVMRENAAGCACYRLHETMREFAAIKLAESGERAAADLLCAGYYRAACQRAAAERRYRLAEWLEWADLEIDNIRAVLQRCLSRGDAAGGIDLATALSWYWITRAATEGLRWLGEFLAAEGGDPRARAWAHFLCGFLAVLKADPVAAGAPLRSAVAASRRAGQPDVLVEALSMASVAQSMAGDQAAASRLLDEAAAAVAETDYPPGRLAVVQARVITGFFRADLDAVRSCAAEGESLARAAGDLYGLEMMLLNLGLAALIAGDLEQAGPLLAEALRIACQIDDRVAQFYLLAAAGCQAALASRARLAARLLGAADMARTQAGAEHVLFIGQAVDRARQTAAAALGAAAFEAETDAGRALSRGAALELALGLAPGEPVAATTPGNGTTGPLSQREADVARLTADGLTNRQIGTRLFISERTVDSHVRSILNKLGFSSRAQIAAWVASPDRGTITR